MTELTAALEDYRRQFEQIFSKDTAHPLSRNNPVPSAGHCAIVAVFLQKMMSGNILSTTEQGSSHWLNHIDGWFVDLTGDQFGFPSIRMWQGDDLSNYRIRQADDLDDDTRNRLKMFIERLRQQ